MGGSRAGSLLGVLILYALAVGWLTWPLARVAGTALPGAAPACRFDTPLIEWILAHETRALTGSPSELLHAGMYHPEPYALFYGPLALGALPLFAPVALATGNPTLAINATLLGGAVLTAFALHVVLWRTTRSHLAGAVGGWTFLTSRWLLWAHVPTNPFYSCLALLPLIIAIVARAREQLSIRRLLPLVVLQCLTDVAYVAAALLVPLACIAVGRACRRAGRAAGLRLLAVVVATPICLAPVYAGYLVVAARNPRLAEQTNWRLHGAAAYPWLGQPLTSLPWGPFEDLAPTSVAPIVGLLVVAGALALVMRARRESLDAQIRRLWVHATIWTVVGLAISFTPTVEWQGVSIDLPQRLVAEWRLVQMLREPGRLAIGALVGASLLSGLAFATLARKPFVRAALAIAIIAIIYVQYAYGFERPFARRPLPLHYPTFTIDVPPTVTAALRDGTGPVLELPVGPGGGVGPWLHAVAMYRSLFHHRPLVNGYSGYWPAGFEGRMALAGRLPDRDALAALRRQTGLTAIVVDSALLTDAAAHAEWEAIAGGSRDDLRFVARDGAVLLFAVDAIPR